MQKGHDATRFALQCFGGAGGQHACLVADALGMETVFIHPYAGVLSAYGMGLADQTVMREQAVETPLEPQAMAKLNELADRLEDQAKAALTAQGAEPKHITVQRNLHLRYSGTEAALIVALRREPEIVADFTAAHRARFGFTTPDRPLVVEAVAVEAIAPGETVTEATLATRVEGAPRAIDKIQMFTGDKDRTAPVFDRTELLAGDRFSGPALIREANATTVVEPGWTAEVTALDHMMLRRTERLATRVDAGGDRPGSSAARAVQQPVHECCRTDRDSAAEHLDEREHQGAAGFLLCHLRCRGVPGGQCAARARASRRDGRERAHRPEQSASHAEARRRRGTEQSVQRWHTSAGCHRHHTGVRRERRQDPVLCRQPRTPRRYRRHHARLDTAGIAHAGRGRRGDRRLPAG